MRKADTTAAVAEVETDLDLDPDFFIKLCDSPRKRRERKLLNEKDRAAETVTRFAYEILLAIGIAFLILAVIK